MTQVFWTTERELLLRQLWADGQPASQIAGAIGQTRNSIIGKAHRLGLPRREKPKSMFKQNPRKKHGDPKAKPPVPVGRPGPVSREKPGISILELNSNSCRQVIGVGKDGLARYCGKQVKPTKWCCEDHYGINYYQGYR